MLDEASKVGVRLILTMADNWSPADSKTQVLVALKYHIKVIKQLMELTSFVKGPIGKFSDLDPKIAILDSQFGRHSSSWSERIEGGWSTYLVTTGVVGSKQMGKQGKGVMRGAA